MAKNKEVKTNAMRILDRLKIDYSHYTYECEEFVDGIQIADKLNLPHEKVYKTLVTVGNSKNYFVFVIPIEAELDLKKAAKAVGLGCFFICGSAGWCRCLRGWILGDQGPRKTCFGAWRS